VGEGFGRVCQAKEMVAVAACRSPCCVFPLAGTLCLVLVRPVYTPGGPGWLDVPREPTTIAARDP
jgi:hypothetical protein